MSARAILSRSALGSLLCTRSDTMAIMTVAQELHGKQALHRSQSPAAAPPAHCGSPPPPHAAHGNRAAATQLLAGCFVRLKRNSVYALGRITALRFPAAGGVVQLELEVSTALCLHRQ